MTARTERCKQLNKTSKQKKFWGIIAEQENATFYFKGKIKNKKVKFVSCNFRDSKKINQASKIARNCVFLAVEKIAKIRFIYLNDWIIIFVFKH